MKSINQKIFIRANVTLIALVLVFRAILPDDSSGNEMTPPSSTHTSKYTKSSKLRPRESTRESNNYSDAASQQKLRSLNLPVLPVDEQRVKEPVDNNSRRLVSRSALSDDDILVIGGVVAVQSRYAPKTADSTDRLRFIKSEDWNGEANLLGYTHRAPNGS
jgi:hypothetical protein